MEQLRDDGDGLISLVAITGDELVGHVMFSKMSAPFKALGLAPVATLESHRRQGIAAKLINAGLQQAKDEAWQAAFVLGDPNYYQRFGFDLELAEGFSSPYSGPYFMAMSLQDTGLPNLSGTVEYAKAFDGLD